MPLDGARWPGVVVVLPGLLRHDFCVIWLGAHARAAVEKVIWLNDNQLLSIGKGGCTRTWDITHFE